MPFVKMSTRCPICFAYVYQVPGPGRPRIYCKNAHRQKSYRRRLRLIRAG